MTAPYGFTLWLATEIEGDLPGLYRQHPDGVSATILMGAYGATYQQVTVACARLHDEGVAQWVPALDGRWRKVLLPPLVERGVM